jgi:hypothetical protein
MRINLTLCDAALGCAHNHSHAIHKVLPGRSSHVLIHDLTHDVAEEVLEECQRPLDLWLLIAVLPFIGFLLAFILGRYMENGNNWWFIQPRSSVAKVAFKCTWAILLPFDCLWSALGMRWLVEDLRVTPDCIPSSYVMLTVCMEVLSCILVMVYLVFVAAIWDAERCRKANADAIRSIEDDDLVNRWGRLKPAPYLDLCGGLSPLEFEDLPKHAIECDGLDCTICLDQLKEGDLARALPACGHVFHRACIDQWLLRQACCPLCKKDIGCHAVGVETQGTVNI